MQVITSFFKYVTPSQLLLRLGLAGSLLYPAIDAWFDPYAWIGYFPTFLTDFVAPHTLILLRTFSLVEIALALWILLGRKVRTPSLLTAGLLLLIVASNISQMQVVFRDISLALAALTLSIMRTKVSAATPPSHA